jgi:RNA polymerase sigma factor (sigma-70 family)
MIKPAKRVSTHDLHEEIFLERYVRLCDWSLRFTQNDRERAEDLVHDLYLQFVHAQPDLDAIKNLDGYLYRTLHNLNISQLRRRGRQHSQPLSVVDYDSAESSLRSADPRELIRYQDDLRQVCHYAAIRKESSKAGSALILRFIHGYYPREIALVMKCTREAVEERLRVARIEARQYLQNPQNLRFLRRTTDIQAPQTGFVTPIDQLLDDLRQQIFDSRHGSCLSTEELKQFYAAEKTEIGTLAHLVSCEHCLNEINRLLELPLLADRFPIDSLGNDQPRNKTGSGDDDGPGGGITGSDLEVLRRRAREVLEHKPDSLCVAVNGDVVAEQSITSKRCNLILNFKEDEQLEFIEIFSGQQTLLLLITVEEATVTMKRSIEFSDGRSLEVTLDLGVTTPKLEVVYSESSLSSEAAEQNPLESPRLVVQSIRPWSFATAFLSQLFSKLTSWLNPATITATVALILIAALLLVRFNVTAVNAKELLARAGTAEKALLAQPDIAIHRTINFEARRLNSTVKQRIEIWNRNGVTVRRLYDENGKLIAGEWSNNDGASTIYRPGTDPQQRTSPEIAGAAILESGELWRLDSSVKIFNTVVVNVDALTVTEDNQSYLLGYRNDGVEEGVTRATLRIDKTTHRSIEQTLTVLKEGISSEYRFAETALEEKALDMVPSSVFQPDTELVSRAGEKVGPPESGARSETSAVESIASPELEIEVTYLLNRIRADLGEQVTLTRTPGGALRVEAITETEQRKSEILRALIPVQHNPAVRIEVSTAEEAARRIKEKTPEREIDGREVEISNTRSPADNELRKYFNERVESDAADDEIRRYTARVMNHSRQALLRAAALQKLAKRFSLEEIKSLAPDARAKWLTMVQEQATGCQTAISSVRAELQRVFPASGASGNAREEDLQTAADRLVQLSYANDDVIRRAFTVSAESGSGQLFSRDFWQSLNAAEQLAKEIQRMAGKY